MKILEPIPPDPPKTITVKEQILALPVNSLVIVRNHRDEPHDVILRTGETGWMVTRGRSALGVTQREYQNAEQIGRLVDLYTEKGVRYSAPYSFAVAYDPREGWL